MDLLIGMTILLCALLNICNADKRAKNSLSQIAKIDKALANISEVSKP